MQLRDAIQDFMLECKVRRLVPRTIDNYGKHLRYCFLSIHPSNLIQVLRELLHSIVIARQLHPFTETKNLSEKLVADFYFG